MSAIQPAAKPAPAGAGPKPGPQPGPQPGPFAWAEEEAFRPVLQAAGFGDIDARSMEFDAIISDGDDPDPVARAADFMMRIGPMASRLRGASPDEKARTRRALLARLADHLRGDAVRLAASAWVITARAV